MSAGMWILLGAHAALLVVFVWALWYTSDRQINRRHEQRKAEAIVRFWLDVERERRT